MAYMDDLLRELEARGATGKIYNAGSSSSQKTSSTQKKKKKEYTEELLTILSQEASKTGNTLDLSNYGTIGMDTFKAADDNIAPIKTVTKVEQEDDSLLDFFQKGALGEIDLRKNFRDGYQFGDVLKTGGHVAGQVGKAILGTAGDVGLGVAKGFASAAEGIADLASYGIAAGLDAAGKDASAKQWRKNAAENTVEEWTKGADEFLNQHSVAGRTMDSIAQGIGQIGSIIATGGLGKAAGLGAKAVTALTTGTMGVSGMGSGMGEAYRAGATDEEAATYGLIAGASDALTELLFGGLGKAVGAVGLSTGLSSADDLLAKKVSGLFTNQIAKNFAEYGIKAGAEGFEEVLAGTAQAIGKKITYMKEEELSEILKDENLLEQFVVGAAASGLMQSGIIPGTGEGSLREANAEGRDFITGYNQNEQSVIDKEVEKRVAAQEEKSGKKLTKKEIGAIEKTVQEDMDKGFISIDTIEEVLGGETYSNYKKLAEAEDAMQREYDELGKKEHYTLADDTRYRELGDRLKYVREKGARSELKKRLEADVSSKVEGSRLAESFRERERRGQTFEADVTQYDAKQQAIVQKAIDSGILNNTRRTHEFVDMVARIGADRGLSFDFTNNTKLKESGFAVEGKTVNGFVTKDGITVNIQSAKSLNSVVGHEITHVLEGTELYTELQKAVFQYAESKKDLAGRRGTLTALYQNIEDADIDAELTADLVGDYLFTDSDFINNLSTNHRNVFQKIYDEVKYLLKVATAGSKEARELEKVKRAFERAYREGGKKAAEDGGAKYSIAETTDGRIAAVVDNDILASIDTTSWDNTKKEAAKKAASEALKQFSGGIVVDGITRKVNRVSRNEYTRSNYTESLYNHTPDVFADKMRAAEVADDIVVAATNWTRDGGLDHPRTDNFVDFDHGTALIVSGGAKYTAEVVVGITDKGEAVFYDVVNLKPATFDTKKAEPPTTATTQDAIGSIHGDSADGTVSQDGGNVKYSLVEDQGTIDFLENQGHLTVYKAMALIDGKLYPPMASQTYVEEEYTTKSGEKKTRRVRRLKNPSVLGRWQQAEERTDIAEKTYDPKKGYSSFDLLKSNGKTTGGVAYNPYEHTSNIVLNDQFSEAYQRPELVTVEYEIPVSELTSGYKAQYAKDPVGLTDWKAGGVAQKLKHGHRDVYLTRWSKPVRVLSDAEVAQKYKEILDKEDGVSVPWNVVTPSLREELEKAGVPIDYSDIKAGSTVRSFEAAVRGDYEKPKKAKASAGVQYSLGKDELLTRLQDKRAELQEWSNRQDDIEDSEEYSAIIRQLVDSGASEDAIARYKAWDAETGYSEIVAKTKAIAKEARDLADLYDKAVSDAWAAEEENAIAKSGVSAAEYFRKKAVKEFGYTPYFYDAGYLLPNGKMLNFSGEKGRHYGTRGQDHRAIGTVYANEEGSNAMYRFMGDGNIRIMAESPGIDLISGVEPTPDQYATIGKFITSAKGRSSFIVDFTNADGTSAGSIRYEGNVSPARVTNDIKHYYATGEVRQQSEVGKFRFSLSEIEDVYQTNIENGDMIGAELAVERAANLAMPNSKIRGADGNLIPVYHGTREMFYEFDTSIKGGANGTAEGFGIYTSDDPEVTAAYGERQIKMYANITKPATSDKKTISPAKLAALIKDTCKKQAQKAVEDGEYDSVQDALLDTWVSNYVYTYDIGMERAYREVAKSILQMNDSDMAVIQEVMSGMAIRDYAEATDFYRNSLIPITGFDGFVTHWENSATGKKSNIYLAFDSNQLKSADTVTYDDNGDIIPLSERFDPEKKDIRRSLSPEGAQQRTFGDYNVYGSDVVLEEDIAPVRQDIAPVAVAKNATTTDIAPATVSKNATVQAPVQEEEEAVASPYEELDRLTEEAEELERQMYAAMDAGDNEAAMEINADLVGAAVRITQLEQQLDADVQERLVSFEDADAPIVREAPYSESTDTVTLPKKMVQSITKEAREALGFSTRRSAEMRQLIERFSQGEIDSEMLYDEIAERFGTYTETERLEDIAEVKKWLRTVPLYVTDDIKADFDNYTASVMRPNFGKIRFTNKGATVDLFYDELNAKYPGFFPADIINPSDQLQRIIEVANMSATTEQVHELDGQMLDAVTDSIVRRVNEFRQEQRRITSEQNSRDAFNSLMADADRYAPFEEGDIAPVRADVAAEPVAEPVAEPAQESAPKQIKTVRERLAAKLQNLQTELAEDRRLREESRVSYDEEIARLQAEYDGKRDKNTKVANNLLRRIERLRRIQSDIDADYEKRINDLAEQTAKASEEARTGESPEAQGAMRRELHASIVESIRFRMAERGIDFDEMLRNANDLSTLATVDNTPQRVMEKALGYKEGQALADMTVNQVAQHETEGIRWLNGYTNRKTGLLAKISKQYRIKPGSKESAAAQMYAEGFYVADNGDIIAYGDRELAADFPDAKVQANIMGLARDPRIRQIYDATLAMINESRARNAYPEIQRLDNYFLHFRAMDDTFSRLGIPFNPNDIRAKDLPTDLNGVTADLKPGQPYFASAMHRRGKRTSFDLLGGLERYLTSAKGQIYHIDDIQTLRALRNHIAETYGQAHGLEGLDAMTEEEAAAQIEQVYDAHLSTFAKFLNEEANVIAGKTALIDRGLEGIIGRRGMTFFDTLNRQVGANMVGFNVSSSLTNFIAPVQAFAKTNKAAFVKGFAQTVAGRLGAITGHSDTFAADNPTMIRRQGADRFYRTPWQKAGDLGYALMSAVDSLSTEIIVRSKYNELVSKGVSHEQAVEMADKWTSRLMGDRSLGQQPQLYNSKMLGLFTKFQLEVRNQLDSQFYDTIQEAKVSAEDIQNKTARNAKIAAQVTSTFVQLAVVQHLFGKAFEAVAGYNPAFDIIEAIVKAFGWDDEEDSEDTVLDNLGQGFMNLLEDMPYSSVATGGRIPIASALPVAQLIKGEDKYGNEKSRLETLAETAPYYLLPGGYGQIKKTTQGLGMFDDDLPIAGSYTDSGNLRYPVEDTALNRAQAAVFGQYASANARDYFDNERQSLKKNQIQELVDVDIPIREYWDYREGLADQETLADKFDYIAGLDLPIDKKNILINNVVDRKEAVDLTDYDDFANYEEFDFAVKNPEKYDFLQSVGVSVAEYQSFDDDTKDAYTWAFQNPEKYTLSRAVTDDVAVYRQYTKALNEIKADKYADGRTVTGSRKTKVLNYLNNLDADYYTKIILFKMEYNADDTYNREIIEYLNGRNDISYEDEVTILRELGFTVSADGTVWW